MIDTTGGAEKMSGTVAAGIRRQGWVQVAFFKRKSKRDDEPVDMNERSPVTGMRYKDIMVLASLADAGADLAQPRHVLYYLYFSSESVARQAAVEAATDGFTVEVREPLPQYPDQWLVLAERQAVTTIDVVIWADNKFQAIADAYGGEYDGWEASV
jgi:hypothetical protein